MTFGVLSFFYVQNVLTALRLFAQGERVFEHEMKTNYNSYTLFPCFLEQDDRSGDEEQMGYTINHEKVEVAENMQEGEREKQRRERSEIKPDEINPRIMSALWSSQSARLSSRRACFTLEMKCECFHSNVLRHSSDGPEVILSR